MNVRITPTHAESGDSGAQLAQLPDDGCPETVNRARSQHAASQQEAALTHPYLGRWPRGSASAQLPRRGSPEPRRDDRPQPAPRHAAVPSPPAGRFTVRAVIGDQIRRPILWCQMGSCITWHADPAALGEADNRARAIAAGWRQDALGRLACPACLQSSPQFRATHPVVPWNRELAVAVAVHMARHSPALRGQLDGDTPRAVGNLRRPEVTLPVNHVWDGYTIESESQV
jgi:hypothetical protein